MVKYCAKPVNVAKAAQARGDNLKVHFKNTYETADAIRGMKVSRAQEFLKNVIIKKEIVPFRKHNGGVGRKAQCKGLNCAFGRWPVKSAQFILKLLKNAVDNAKAKGLNTALLTVSHIAVQEARSSRRRLYRAHGSINSFSSSPCHIELILTEKEKKVAKPTEGIKGKKSTHQKIAYVLN
ncbi:60S ribosomal protein L17, putative [Entamoeba dispar SAW760]|uniref:60S ribosomal protein L17, putative n=1 Tax=Entamoeba dispar (strain ATCC PRA-260 / SAW760) TaxID=370354 RepID=B0E652_ENTDS|nr:60S ribosomal protein L17, putative [Entamoeba dispar SAW760]EDR30025.1 60S ribosomal protein L17, putative [Entamoeba dispar SAW760]|eukprot:EDR30025.1 60S ribosomal protein L17, putative [Entamoeba dispar SAW760]